MKYMIKRNRQRKQKWNFSDSLLAIKNTKPTSQQTELLSLEKKVVILMYYLTLP